MIVDANTIQTLHIAYSTLFELGLKPMYDDWGRIARVVPMPTKTLEMTWLKQIPQIKKAFGPAVYENAIRSKYSISADPYRTNFGIDVDDIEDDNLGTTSMAVEQIAEEASGWLSEAVYTLLPRGLTEPGFDGVPFFSAAHPMIGGSTYSNFATDSGEPWYLLDTRRAVKPLIVGERRRFSMSMMSDANSESVFNDDEVRWKIRGRYGWGYGFPQTAYCSKKTLNEANFEAALTAMTNQKREDGKKLNIRPDVIVVSPANEFAAKRILKAVLLATGGTAGTNIHAGSLEIIVSPHVASADIDL